MHLNTHLENLYLTVYYFIVIGFWHPYETNVWECLTCEKKYKHRQSLQNHKKFECGVEKMFQCHICNKRFRYKCSLTSHLAIIHKVLFA